MHSFDRTLLARLGFDDPDKKDRRHDLACQYLALPENYRRVVSSLEYRPVDLCAVRPIFESVITKGQGRYATTIGFADLYLPYETDGIYDDGKRSPVRHWLGVEVKIHPVGVGDILRQINLYRPYAKVGHEEPKRWLVATAFSLPSLDVATLRTASIRHIRLGEAFHSWCETARVASDEGSEQSIDI